MAGLKLTSGSCNVFMGECAGKCIDTQSRNTFIGSRAGHYFCGADNVAVGWGAGLNVSGDYNVFLGRYSGKSTTNQNTHRNTGLGYATLCNIDDGCCNVAAGQNAGNKTSSGSNNVFMGSCAGYCNTTGSGNVFIGNYSAKSGGGAVTGSNNTALGTRSMCNITSGATNVAIGYDAGRDISTSSCNVFIGMCAGNNVNSGGSNVAIGPNVEPAGPTGSCQLVIGVGSNEWITGDSNFVVSSGNALEAGTFFQNATSLDTNTTFPASGTKNGGVFGPYTISNGVTLTISSGSTFTII